MTVITGETGAGKSILVQALSDELLGAVQMPLLVRKGAA
jgi:DNA repair ATPase RecN